MQIQTTTITTEMMNAANVPFTITTFEQTTSATYAARSKAEQKNHLKIRVGF